MKKCTPLCLVLVGGFLIASPLAYSYFTYRLIASVLTEALIAGQESPKVNFSPSLPEYYVPVAFTVGVICLFSGIILVVKNSKLAEDSHDD